MTDSTPPIIEKPTKNKSGKYLSLVKPTKNPDEEIELWEVPEIEVTTLEEL